MSAVARMSSTSCSRFMYSFRFSLDLRVNEALGSTGVHKLVAGEYHRDAPTFLSFSFRATPHRRSVLRWVYDLSLGRGSAQSFWLRQLRQCAVPLPDRRVRPIHRSHLAPAHRSRDCSHPGVSKRLLRFLLFLVRQLQAPAANLHRVILRRSPPPELVAELRASVGPRCNRTPAAHRYRKIQVLQAEEYAVPEP